METTNEHTSELSINHRTKLHKENCISETVMERACLGSIDGDLANRLVDQRRGGILFSYYDFGGEQIGIRVRHDEPITDRGGRQRRYSQPRGTSITCYFLRDAIPKIAASDSPLIIVEGEKKVLCLESIPVLANYAKVAMPGCWSFVQKDEKRLSDMWRQIPWSRRKVFWIPDSDYFTSPKVTMAGDLFLRLLFNAGAIVHVVDLREDGGAKKVGVDDYVLQYGPDAFIEKLQSPIWLLDDMARLLERIEPTDKCVRSILAKLVILPSLEIESIFQGIKLRTKLTLSVLREIHAEIKEQWEQLRPGAAGHDRSRIIRLDGTIERRKVLEEVAGILSVDGRFFNYGEELLMVDNGKKFLVTAQTLPGAISDLGIEFAKKGKTCLNFYTMPSNISQIFCQSRPLKSGLREIIFFTDHPTYDRNWELVRPGYHQEDGIYYMGAGIVPSRSTGLLESIIKDFAFRNPASRVNFIAMLLTAILRNRYRGDRPFAALTGNRPQIGKTLACKVISIVAEGLAPQSLSFVRNQEEFEKQIAALLRTRDTLQIDNVKSAHPIDSPPLERLVTDDPINYRILGETNTFSRPNTSLILVTMNDAKFCTDLITRALPIELFLADDVDPSKKTFAHDDLVEVVFRDRMGIVAELCGLIENWKERGFPTCSKNFRFKVWAKEIGGILEANGMTEFLDNYETAASAYDRTANEVAMILEPVIGRPVTAAELVYVCEEMDVFPDLRGTKKASMALSHLLVKYVGKTLQMPDGKGQIILRAGKSERTGTKTYVAELVAPAGPHTAPAWTLHSDAGTRMDSRSECPSALTDGHEKRNGSSAGTAGTETPPGKNGANGVAQRQGGTKKTESCIGPVFVPAVPARPLNPSSSQLDPLHGQSHGPKNNVPADGGGSMQPNGKSKGNNLDWRQEP